MGVLHKNNKDGNNPGEIKADWELETRGAVDFQNDIHREDGGDTNPTYLRLDLEVVITGDFKGQVGDTTAGDITSMTRNITPALVMTTDTADMEDRYLDLRHRGIIHICRG